MTQPNSSPKIREQRVPSPSHVASAWWPNHLLTFTVLVSLLVGGLCVRAAYVKHRWKRFAVVEPGLLYRSGQLSRSQLATAIDRLKLKTVVCLNPDHSLAEHAICRSRGIDFHFFPMPSDGLGAPDYFAKTLRIIADRRRQPVLVHCRAGVARTGAAVAMYRVLHEGWSVDRAIAELRTFERRGRCEPSLQQHIRELCTTMAMDGKTILSAQAVDHNVVR